MKAFSIAKIAILIAIALFAFSSAANATCFSGDKERCAAREEALEALRLQDQGLNLKNYIPYLSPQDNLRLQRMGAEIQKQKRAEEARDRAERAKPLQPLICHKESEYVTRCE